LSHPGKMNLLIDLQYLPCLEYFAHLLRADIVYLEAHENFQKQSYRNRCVILTTNKIDTLTVPVLKSNSKQLIREVEVDYSQPWQKIHWKAIKSAYGKAPYYEYFSEYFEKIYDKKPRFLWDLNYEILTVCLGLLRLKKELLLTTEYNKEAGIHVKEVLDKRSLVHPKKQGEMAEVKYTQVFGREFVSNLSIIDLIFNEGPNGTSILKKGFE
jgi:hypothetical protein